MSARSRNIARQSSAVKSKGDLPLDSEKRQELADRFSASRQTHMSAGEKAEPAFFVDVLQDGRGRSRNAESVELSSRSAGIFLSGRSHNTESAEVLLSHWHISVSSVFHYAHAEFGTRVVDPNDNFH